MEMYANVLQTKYGVKEDDNFKMGLFIRQASAFTCAAQGEKPDSDRRRRLRPADLHSNKIPQSIKEKSIMEMGEKQNSLKKKGAVKKIN